MSYQKPPDDCVRFFARPRSFDIACPKCDYVQAIKPTTNRRIWNPRVARFQCMGCGLILHIGMVAWRAAHGKFKTPDDQTPTVQQALALRRQLNLFTQTRLMRGRSTNILADEPPPVSTMVEGYDSAGDD